MIRVQNKTRETTVATDVRAARSFWSRLRGLLGTSPLNPGEGLLIEPCSSVHMFGMTYPLDVIFSDRRGVVVGVVENLRPWKATKVYRGARVALELPVGSVSASGTEAGDSLEFEEWN